MPTHRAKKRLQLHTSRCKTWLLPILAVPLVLGVTHRCWLGPFAKLSSSQASHDVDSLEHHGSRRAGLFSAAAALLANEVGAAPGMAQESSSAKTKAPQIVRSFAPGEGNGLFRYNQQGGLINADTNQLASRVVQVPPNPDRCQGADDGDLIGIRYAGAFEKEGMKGAAVDTLTEARIDLLDDEEAAPATARWAVFDSSERRQGPVPFQIPLGGSNTFLGLDMALHGLCRGERRVLYIPPSLGPGQREAGGFGVPENVALRYDVEVTNVITWNRPQNKQGTPPSGRRIVGRLLEESEESPDNQ